MNIINLFTQFFTFSPNHFVVSTQEVIYIPWRIVPIEDKSIPFKFFLTIRMLFASSRVENLIATLFGPLPGNQ